MTLIDKSRIDNLNRKIIHAVSALIICLFPYFLRLWQIVFISLFFAFIFFISRRFKFLPIINRVKRSGWGVVYYPLGVMISALVFLPQGEILAFQFGILVLGFSDAMANILGDLYGRHRIDFYWGKKSLEGSFFFFLTTLLILLIFAKFNFSNIAAYLGLSLALTIVEFSLFFGLDNLFLPFISSYLFLIISSF